MTGVVILVQARLGSMRYPGKVLQPFCAMPMLAYQVRRLLRAGLPVHVLVPSRDIARVRRTVGSACLVRIWGISGNPADVLGRFARFARRLPWPARS